VVGFKIGNVPLEEMEMVVQRSSQTQTLHQQEKSSQTATMQSVDLVGEIIMDVLGSEQGSPLLVPLLFAESVLDATLGIAEQLVETALARAEPMLYPGFHLKYLPVGEKDER